MERFDLPSGGLAVVDYAHTPDALDNVLSSIRELDFKRLIVVFGCGGNRDAGKRPLMGEVVGRAASICTLRQCSPREVYEKYLPDLIERKNRRVATMGSDAEY